MCQCFMITAECNFYLLSKNGKIPLFYMYKCMKGTGSERQGRNQGKRGVQ